MGPRHPHPRVPLLAVSLVVLLAVALGVALWSRPSRAAIPLDPHIPNGQALIDLGLSGTPGPGQPSRPVVVDRVLVDRAATYVQYHLLGSGMQSDPLPPLPTLTDDHGVMVRGGAPGGSTSFSDWPFPLPLPAWVPWHPRTIQRAYAILGPLPATVHAAVLHFDGLGGLGGSGAGETVRVPLDLRALARRRVIHPNKRVGARGLTLTVRDLDFDHLTYTYVLSGHAVAAPRGAYVTDLTGRAIRMPVSEVGASCTSDRSRTRCSIQMILPLQRPGTRLTLTIPTFLILRFQGAPAPLHGPWRFSFVTP